MHTIDGLDTADATSSSGSSSSSRGCRSTCQLPSTPGRHISRYVGIDPVLGCSHKLPDVAGLAPELLLLLCCTAGQVLLQG
jgi:hypothetical protein